MRHNRRWVDETSTDPLTTQLCESLTEEITEVANCGDNGETRGAYAKWGESLEFAVDPWDGA